MAELGSSYLHILVLHSFEGVESRVENSTDQANTTVQEGGEAHGIALCNITRLILILSKSVK